MAALCMVKLRIHSSVVLHLFVSQRFHAWLSGGLIKGSVIDRREHHIHQSNEPHGVDMVCELSKPIMDWFVQLHAETIGVQVCFVKIPR